MDNLLHFSLQVATFDGDTPREDRQYIRENANVIFTNPDMLHINILPREEEWRRFFQNLRIVVVDGQLSSASSTSVRPDFVYAQNCICITGYSARMWRLSCDGKFWTDS